jgi:hypothetical protein
METEDCGRKYVALKILKSIQEYLTSDNHETDAVYPIQVPRDLLIQIVKYHGSRIADELINEMFQVGLKVWAEQFYLDVFEPPENPDPFLDEARWNGPN